MAGMIPAAKPFIGDEEREAVDRVLRSGMIAGGPEVKAFEDEFSEHVDGHECVAVNSGTSALHMGLIAAGVRQGDEVIVPSFTFAATGNSVALAGAKPVFVDIEPETFCIAPEAIEAAVTDRTVGIMPVHLYGHPANMPAIFELATKHDLKVFEDAAQAHDASLNGTPVGAFGDFAAFSFYPTKNMTSAEGGMVSCANSELARMVRLLRNQGMERRYENEVIGFNTRMTDVHAAIGRVQLTRLPEWTKKRQVNAAFFDKNIEGVITPVVAPGAVHVYHQYTIKVVDQDRDAFAQQLAERGVGSGVYYPTPTHALPSFGLDLDLPVTTEVASQVLSLPVYPGLTEGELETIVHAVNAVAKAGS